MRSLWDPLTLLLVVLIALTTVVPLGLLPIFDNSSLTSLGADVVGTSTDAIPFAALTSVSPVVLFSTIVESFESAPLLVASPAVACSADSSFACSSSALCGGKE